MVIACAKLDATQRTSAFMIAQIGQAVASRNCSATEPVPRLAKFKSWIKISRIPFRHCLGQNVLGKKILKYHSVPCSALLGFTIGFSNSVGQIPSADELDPSPGQLS